MLWRARLAVCRWEFHREKRLLGLGFRRLLVAVVVLFCQRWAAQDAPNRWTMSCMVEDTVGSPPVTRRLASSSS